MNLDHSATLSLVALVTAHASLGACISIQLLFKTGGEPISLSPVHAANTCCDLDLITCKNFIDPDGLNFYCFYCYSTWVVFKNSID